MRVSVCVWGACGNISLSGTRVAHKFLAVPTAWTVMNFDINENTINQSGYLRPEQHAAVFGLKTGIPAKPEAWRTDNPNTYAAGRGRGVAGALHIHLKSVWTVAEAELVSSEVFVRQLNN